MTHSGIPPTPEDIKDCGDGIRRYWLFDHKVVVFESHGESRQTVERWFQVTLETLQDWPPDQPTLTIHDFSQSNPTTYARGRARKLTHALRHNHGHSILVVRDSLLGNLIQIFVDTGLAGSQPNVERHVVKSIDEAVQLAQRLVDQIT